MIPHDLPMAGMILGIAFVLWLYDVIDKSPSQAARNFAFALLMVYILGGAISGTIAFYRMGAFAW